MEGSKELDRESILSPIPTTSSRCTEFSSEWKLKFLEEEVGLKSSVILLTPVRCRSTVGCLLKVLTKEFNLDAWLERGFLSTFHLSSVVSKKLLVMRKKTGVPITHPTQPPHTLSEGDREDKRVSWARARPKGALRYLRFSTKGYSSFGRIIGEFVVDGKRKPQTSASKAYTSNNKRHCKVANEAQHSTEAEIQGICVER